MIETVVIILLIVVGIAANYFLIRATKSRRREDL